MANFNTHLAVASVGSGLCATVALAGHAAPNNYLLTLTLAGTIGGILPDIDLRGSSGAHAFQRARHRGRIHRFVHITRGAFHR